MIANKTTTMYRPNNILTYGLKKKGQIPSRIYSEHACNDMDNTVSMKITYDIDLEYLIFFHKICILKYVI